MGNFTRTFNGGLTSLCLGMESAFGFSQACPHRQTWRLLPTQRAPWDLVLTSRMSGSAGRGAPSSPISQSLTKNSFQWWLLRTCGAHDGTDAMSCSALTMRLWCTLPLLLFTYVAFITRLLMLSPVSIGRSSGIWRLRLYRILPQFLTSCGIF